MSSSETILFRADSLACQFFTIWVRTLGIEYIWNTLAVPINDLNDNAVRRDKRQGKEEGGYKLRGRNYKTKYGSVRSNNNSSSILGSSSDSKLNSKRISNGCTDTSSAQVLTMDSMEVDPSKLEQNFDESDRTVNTLQLW